MKKLIIMAIFVLGTIIAWGQATPSAQFRVATATTDFGINIPIGTTVYCVATDKYYTCKTAALANDDLTSASAKFTQVAGGDMTKAVYDTDADNIVDDAEKVHNALTISTGLQLNSGSTFDGSAAKTLSVKVSEIDHNQLLNYVAEKHFYQKDIDTVNTSLSGILKVTNGVLSAVTDNSANWNKTYIVEEFDESETGETGQEHTLTGTPVATTVTIELNGMALKTSQYSLSTNHFTIEIPVYQYDRVKISYKY